MALSPELIQKQNEEYQARQKALFSGVPQATTSGQPEPLQAPETNKVNDKAIRITPDISREEQIKRFGGEVGSAEYYKNLNEKRTAQSLGTRIGVPVAIPTAVGAIFGPPGAVAGAAIGAAAASDMPDQETWDKLSFPSKASTVLTKEVLAPVKMAFGLPVAFMKAIPNLASIPIRYGEGIGKKGGVPSLQELAQNESETPMGLDPIYQNAYKNAQNLKGMGASDTVASAYGWLSVGLEGLNNALISQMFAKGVKSFVQKPERISTPGSTEISPGSVKNTSPIIPKDAPKVVGTSVYQTVPIEFAKEVSQKTKSSGQVYYKFTPAGEGTVEVALVQKPGLLEFGKKGAETKIESVIVNVNEQAAQTTGSLEPLVRPIKGFENEPITIKQVENLSNIAKANNIDPAIKDMVVKNMTGKKVVGELTAEEYFKTADVLSKMNKTGEFAPGSEASLWSKYAGQYISPARSWMAGIQNKTKIPIYDAWLDIEKGYQLANTKRSVLNEESRGIFGEYADASAKSKQMRVLVFNHMRGDSNAITNNPALSAAEKTSLLKVVDGVSNWFEKTGVELNVPKEIYRKNNAGYYLPEIADIGGIIQRYKGAEFPGSKTFFAKELKKGSANVLVDDPLALMDIYSKQGTEAMFLDNPLARAKELHDLQVPKEFKDSFKSAVQEKLGYEGKVTKLLDDATQRINQYLRTNLAPDAGRKANQALFTYAYVNSLNSPATWARNVITNNVILYSRLGDEFYGQALKKATSPEGLKEVREKGFLMESGSPYGEDLGSFSGRFKDVSQKALIGQTTADAMGRAQAYWQSKFIFEDTLAKYNRGKITWEQAEQKLKLGAMDRTEATRVKNNLVSGNTEQAFQEYARSIIDETNFPFRRGSSSRITFGEGGKIGTFLYKWNIEFAHTLGRWVKNGQWDNLVRYYAGSVAVTKAFKEAFGIDFSRSLYLGPLSVKYPPVVEAGMNIIKMLQNSTDTNSQAFDDAHQSLTKFLKTFGMPGGVDVKNWQDFWRAYNAGPISPGLYQPRNADGSTAGNPVPFSDLWKRLFGFPTISKVEFAKEKEKAANETKEVNDAKRKVAELINAGKDDEADKIILKFEARGIDVYPAESSYDRFELPEGERIYDKLNSDIKDKHENLLNY